MGNLQLPDNVKGLCMRYKEHIMYRHSKLCDTIEYARTTIYLHSNNKVKFEKLHRCKYELYLESPMVRGVKVWEMLPIAVQRATTKVKFKAYIYMKQICRR